MSEQSVEEQENPNQKKTTTKALGIFEMSKPQYALLTLASGGLEFSYAVIVLEQRPSFDFSTWDPLKYVYEGDNQVKVVEDNLSTWKSIIYVINAIGLYITSKFENDFCFRLF